MISLGHDGVLKMMYKLKRNMFLPRYFHKSVNTSLEIRYIVTFFLYNNE